MPKTKANMDRFVVGGTADEAETLATIRQCYEQNQYLLDTHTAVALKVSREYRQASGSQHIAVVDSTAHPCKFVASVMSALGEPTETVSELDLLEQLVAKTGIAQHRGLQNLEQKPVRHTGTCAKDDILATVKDILKL